MNRKQKQMLDEIITELDWAKDFFDGKMAIHPGSDPAKGIEAALYAAQAIRDGQEGDIRLDENRQSIFYHTN